MKINIWIMVETNFNTHCYSKNIMGIFGANENHLKIFFKNTICLDVYSLFFIIMDA